MIHRRIHFTVIWGLTLSLIAVAISAMVMMVGCHKDQGIVTTWTAPVVSSRLPTTEQTVRVRIIKHAAFVVFENSSGLWLAPPGGGNWKRLKRLMPSPVRIQRVGGEYTISDGNQQRIRWQVDELMIVSQDGSPVIVNDRAYPQTVLLHAGNGDKHGGYFDVINHVKMESYLPGVLQKELYSDWHPTAFAAQAIAARTYAMHQAITFRGRHFDLESTTASQAYVGALASHKARQAAAQTAGQVLLHQGRIFSAYYSSSCGGTGQDAVWAFPDGSDIMPLRGTHRRNWCKQSKYYRWGPIHRSAVFLARRMAAWGRANKHAIASISAIKNIAIDKTNQIDRPTRFMVIDRSGRSYKLNAEQMRFACNYEMKSNPAQILRSSHMQVQVRGNIVTFYDGRGFGHGVGLCQWGAQAMAQYGYDYVHILRTYYPGAQLHKLY